jgi:hypothetical protein
VSPLETFMFDWFGDTLFNVLLFNIVLFGPGALAAGRAVAVSWRPWWHIVVYTAFLAAALRFFDYALGGGDFLVPGGFLLSWIVLLGFALFAYRLTRVHQMVRQYPWLYRRKSLLDWEETH